MVGRVGVVLQCGTKDKVRRVKGLVGGSQRVGRVAVLHQGPVRSAGESKPVFSGIHPAAHDRLVPECEFDAVFLKREGIGVGTFVTARCQALRSLIVIS